MAIRRAKIDSFYCFKKLDNKNSRGADLGASPGPPRFGSGAIAYIAPWGRRLWPRSAAAFDRAVSSICAACINEL